MPYPCNRCGHVITPQPSMCCGPCNRAIDKEAESYARRTMRESDQVMAEWRRQDKVLESKGGCALVILAGAALPLALTAFDVVRFI